MMTRKCKSIKKLRQDDGSVPDTAGSPALLNLPVSLVSVLRTFLLESTQEMLINAVEYFVMGTKGFSLDVWFNSGSFVLSIEI